MTNPYCEAAGIGVPKLDAVKGRRGIVERDAVLLEIS